MRSDYKSKLDKKKRYLQVALNSTLSEARHIISQLPVSDRILIEAGTPLIKQYGMEAIRSLRRWYGARMGVGPAAAFQPTGPGWIKYFIEQSGLEEVQEAAAMFGVGRQVTKKTPVGTKASGAAPWVPYIVADMKTMDRGETEVKMVAEAGASAAIALGSAPIETLNTFVLACQANGIDAMIDMMNVEYSVPILRKLKKPPVAVIVHRGVDEERDNREKQVPFHEIRRIKGNLDVLVSVAGGDTPREVQRAVFNDADIVVIWKSVYNGTKETLDLVEGFLKEIK